VNFQQEIGAEVGFENCIDMPGNIDRERRSGDHDLLELLQLFNFSVTSFAVVHRIFF